MKKSNKAFTLIELLVVVLIIGILAAIAVPQYQLSVVKSRASTILPVLTNLVSAEESYYLANGEYTNIIENLDVTLPAYCSKLEQERWQCGNFFMIRINLPKNEVLVDYCPDNTDSLENCSNKRDFQFAFHMSDSDKPNVKDCVIKNNSTLGERLCKTFVGIMGCVGSLCSN